jgi:hypothetical protein
MHHSDVEVVVFAANDIEAVVEKVLFDKRDIEVPRQVLQAALALMPVIDSHDEAFEIILIHLLLSEEYVLTVMTYVQLDALVRSRFVIVQ